MKISIMKNKRLTSAVKSALCVLFWLAVWEILALIVNHSYFLPSFSETLVALFRLIQTDYFFKSLLLTLLRVLAGLVSGIFIGALLAVLSHKINLLKSLIAPIMSVIKATPVATVIIILWIALSADTLAIAIAIMMVVPIVWQNLIDGFSSISPELIEVCEVYEFSFGKKMKYLVLPTLLNYFIPAVITSIGLAWKAEIATEIIAYVKNSIGYYINDAKYYYESDTVFAWTLVIITMSMLLEKLTKRLLSRYNI
jgi:NitT/TauT family transport system permease protein